MMGIKQLEAFFIVLALGMAMPAWAQEPVRAQLAQSLPLLGIDRVHQELRLFGSGVGVLVIDDWTRDESGFVHGQAVVDIIKAVAPGVRLSLCRLEFARAGAQELASCLWRTMQQEELPIRVVNLSLSVGDGLFSRPCDFIENPVADAIRRLARLGVIFVAAAGNDGIKNALRFPACLPEVISVGATYDFSGFVKFDTEQVYCQDQAAPDKVACYSDLAEYLGVVAPGSTINTPSTRDFGGTSAAAPLVSGLIALILEANPSWNRSQILQTLQQTATPAYDAVTSRFYPRVNGYLAVRAAAFSRSLNSIREFDVDADGVIDDAEFFLAVDQWIAAQIRDELFFEVVDRWLQPHPLMASGYGHLKEAQEIRLFDLQGREIAELRSSPVEALRPLMKTLANGVYIYVATLQKGGHRIRHMGKLVVLR